MADHSELVAEIPTVEKMATPDRLKLAKKRRSQQLKRFANYEKQLDKEKNKKNKQSQNQKRSKKRARVKFIHNVMLLEAAARNDVEEVRKLLMSGVDPNVTNEDGLTALHQCCIDDSEDMLKLLLEFGANVNARDSEMWTPLHAAATCGHVHLCKLLIDKGAELLAVNADGNMPYDICEDEVCLDFIETEMAKRGITQEEIDEKRLETERVMLKDLKRIAAEHASLEFRDKNRATPLHVAAANGYLDCVEFLLNQNVSMEVRDEDGWLPIHAAACWLQPEVIEMLVKHGADIDAKTRSGETPFDLAEDPDVKQKILDLKDEMETHRASKSKDHIRSRRINTRGASIRRTSMRGEKRPLSKKEAKDEASHLFGQSLPIDDEDPEFMDDDKENLPATNIDDVKISIIEDEMDKAVSNKSNSDYQEKSSKSLSPKSVEGTSPSQKEQDSQKVKDRVLSEPATQHSNESQRISAESKEPNKPDLQRRSHEPEPIHIHMGRTDSSSNSKPSSHSPRTQDTTKSRESAGSVEHRVLAPNPVVQQLQTGASVTRTPSFQKKRESQRRRSQEHLLNAESDQNNSHQPGTLADLKKQRSEQHKFGNGLDAQVQSLFLHSLSDAGKKYSGSNISSTQQQTGRENTQNGKNVKNSSNVTGQSRPPAYISDNGQLRRFSAPSSHPVVGDDDKFKNDCCSIL